MSHPGTDVIALSLAWKPAPRLPAVTGSVGR